MTEQKPWGPSLPLLGLATVESGTYALTEQPLTTAETSGAAFAAKVGCTRDIAACLRALPAAKIVDNENFTGYRPDVDGRVLTQHPGTLSLVPPRPRVETNYAAEHQCGFWAAVGGGA
jgi:carboxylesterase type B